MNLEKKDRKRERNGFYESKRFSRSGKTGAQRPLGRCRSDGLSRSAARRNHGKLRRQRKRRQLCRKLRRRIYQSSGGHYEIPDFVWTALIIFGTLLSIYALVCLYHWRHSPTWLRKVQPCPDRSQGRAGFRPVFAVSPLRRRLSAEPSDVHLYFFVVAPVCHSRHCCCLQLFHGALHSL